MSIRFVYGKSGSGKSNYCFEHMKLLSQRGERVYYMTPEQFSLESERRIAQEFGSDEANNVEVDSFARLARMIFSHLGPLYRKHIDDAGRAMIAEKTLIALENKLSYLSDCIKETDFVNEVIKISYEFARRCISYDDLINASQNIENPLTRMKLEDIALIYKTYCETLQNVSGSKEDEMELLCKKIEDSKFFEGAYFVIENFEGFTPQELSVIKVILAQVEEMTISFVADSTGGYSQGLDVFHEPKKTIAKLTQIAEEVGAELLPAFNAGECKKYGNFPALLHLEKNYFRYPYKTYDEETDDVTIIIGKNYYSEAEAVAMEIKRLIMTKDYRFRDIVVATRNSEVYFPIIRHVFNTYGIDCYINSKTPASQHGLCRAVMTALEVIISNYSSVYVKRYIKSEYSNVYNDRAELENYVLAAGIDRNKWKNDFAFVPFGYDRKEVERLNDVRKTLIAPFESFFDKFSGRKNANEIAEALYSFLGQSGIKTRAEDRIAQLSHEGELERARDIAMAWRYIIQVIDGIADTVGEEKITFEKFYKIFAKGLECYSMVQPPLMADRVQVCELDGYKSKNPKAFFVVGAVDGVIPKGYLTEGIISDSERKVLKKMGLDLANDTSENQLNEQLVIYNLLTSAAERLYLCCPTADNEGSALTGSKILRRVKEILPSVRIINSAFICDTDNDLQSEQVVFNELIEKLAEETPLDSKWATVKKWFMDNRPEDYQRAIDALNYTNTAHRLSQKSIDLLYGSTTHSSISRIEGYSRCQFAHFIQYGLAVRPRTEYELKAVDMGSLMHEVIEKFSRHMQERDGGWAFVDKEYVKAKTEEITNDVVHEFLGDLSLGSAKFNRISLKIKRIMFVTIWNIAEFYKHSQYEPFAYELEFGGEEIPPIVVTLSDGRTINMVGKVDRIDVLRDDEGTYVSIVDYKSGKKDFDYSKVAAGLQVQLPVYLKAICDSYSGKGNRMIPAAMLYYTFDAPIIKAGEATDEKEIWEKTAAELRMKGILLEDEKSMPELQVAVAGRARVLAEEIDKLCDFTFNKLKAVLEEMVSGSIAIKPYRQGQNTACDYCEYKDICKFDPSVKGNSYRSLIKTGKEAIFSNGD